MKKLAQRTLLTVTAIAALVSLGLGSTTVVNAVATRAERDRIQPYGSPITVAGRQMNVLIAGKGPDIVLLPGFGTASPVLDFAPLVSHLAVDHRVIVVEPFGYGLSDGTDRERTTENIVSEIHEAVTALGLDRYVLMGHSIAGIYAIDYATRYPDEVTAFVGIDSSVPGQPGMDTEFPTGLLAVAKHLGLVRLAAAASPGDYSDPAYSDHDRAQLGILSNRNSLSPTYLNEMAHIRSNFAAALGTGFPQDLPLLLFVVSDNAKNPNWLELHEQQAADVLDGTVVPVDGEHYLHHTHAEEIADGVRSWMSSRSESIDE